jgi:hypothetical protein
MVTIDVQKVGQGPETIDIRVVVTAQAGSPGIEYVRVTGISEDLLYQIKLQKCPANHTVVLHAVPLDKLPIYVDVRECQTGVDQGQAVGETTSRGPFLGVDLGDCKAHVNNQACENLQQKITSLRLAILLLCGLAAVERDTRNALAVALASIMALVSAMIVLTLKTPWPFNMIPAALGTAFTIAAIAVFIVLLQHQAKLDELNGTMNSQRQQMVPLILRLDDVCCPEFIYVPRDVPLCN